MSLWILQHKGEICSAPLFPQHKSKINVSQHNGNLYINCHIVKPHFFHLVISLIHLQVFAV